jgi:hypothetical protein
VGSDRIADRLTWFVWAARPQPRPGLGQLVGPPPATGNGSSGLTGPAAR